MLGIIRMRSGGLLMAIVTHVFADIVIFCILLDIVGRI
jgi:membrane protease YdiL (CAAX protease family)